MVSHFNKALTVPKAIRRKQIAMVRACLFGALYLATSTYVVECFNHIAVQLTPTDSGPGAIDFDRAAISKRASSWFSRHLIQIRPARRRFQILDRSNS